MLINARAVQSGSLQRRLVGNETILYHRHHAALCEILSSEAGLDNSGNPYISQSAFETFLQYVPHLFRAGTELDGWLERMAAEVAHWPYLNERERTTVGYALRVIRQAVRSAAICAPTDLWLMRYVLASLDETGILNRFRRGEQIDEESLAAQEGFEHRFLDAMLSLLCGRGLVIRQGGKCLWSTHRTARAVLATDWGRLASVRTDWREVYFAQLTSKSLNGAGPIRDDGIGFNTDHLPVFANWMAGPYEIELGSWLVPLVLALEKAGFLPRLRRGAPIGQIVPNLNWSLLELLYYAGLIDGDAEVTALGARVFERAAGPFGIIHSYRPYCAQLTDLLTGKSNDCWVERVDNTSACIPANRRKFTLANDLLDRFCQETGYRYEIFIEHAMGQAEATRQRYQRSGSDGITYFGADLEDAVFEATDSESNRSTLPPGLQFVRGADLGAPETLTGALSSSGVLGRPMAMVVGNGFHEVRGQTNASMTEVFRKYHDAGILLVFTEESALTDEQLLQTGWNTYHAGFRFIHDISGQELRPTTSSEQYRGRIAWLQCVQQAGYCVPAEYIARSRLVLPCSESIQANTPISVTFLGVPAAVADGLRMSASPSLAPTVNPSDTAH